MILALDTALETCSACLWENGLIAKKSEPMTKGHAESLVPFIEECLNQASLKASAIKQIAVTRGPGSFTGLRVALAAAKSFGIALNIPVSGVNTLEALSFGAKREIMALIDARHNHSYAMMLLNWETTLEPALYSNDHLKDIYRKKDCQLIGSGAKFLNLENVETQIQIEAVAQLALLKPNQPSSPLYLKEADVTPQIKGIIPRV